jgi:hypothetical protein
VCMWVKPGVAVCSLNGFLPTASQRVPSIYRKPNFFYRSSVRQSNRKWVPRKKTGTARGWLQALKMAYTETSIPTGFHTN